MRTFAPLPTPTNALQPYFVESLRSRPYTAGTITVVAPLERNSAYTRYLITYYSDGLRITGLMNLPPGDGPFPVIILNHGYYEPASYVPGDGTQLFADAFARQGYLTLTPDYRIYGGSDQGPDPYRTGFAVDLVNLIASVRSLPQARADDIGLWGHSMGGGVALEALVMNPPGVRAAVLLAPMSGDFAENYSAIVAARGGAALGPDWTIAPQDDPEAYQQLSPINYLKYVSVPVQIHHGQSDLVVPPGWSAQLAQALTDAGKDATFYLYPGAGHFFYSDAWSLCVARTLEFFNSTLEAR
jgi:dipeptidyl aminopeptidase/acylaminoacyl peptidase